jgi:DNA-binding NtrC family response regulator
MKNMNQQKDRRNIKNIRRKSNFKAKRKPDFKAKTKPNFKSIFIVDPVKGERLHLAKLLKQEKLLVMTFVNLTDCFKPSNPIKPNLVIFVMRKGKTEANHMENIKKIFKTLHFILLLTSEVSDVDLSKLQENGFSSVQKAGSQDKVKEMIYDLLPECQIAPDIEVLAPQSMN